MQKSACLNVPISRIGNGIMRKVNATLTNYEIQRNTMIAKVRYMIEQYFGITEKYQEAGKSRFAALLKEWWGYLCGAVAFNIKRVNLAMRNRQIAAPVNWAMYPPLYMARN